MMLSQMPGQVAQKLADGATSAAGLAAYVARHLAWYVSHQMSGRARKRG